MSDKTGIEWTDATWNPVTGCTKVSQGCKHCYAERDWARLAANPATKYSGREFTDVATHRDTLALPCRWSKPRRIFVNSMSDLFHEAVPFEFIAAVFGVMAAASWHTFQVLTKRPQRALEFFAWIDAHPERNWFDGLPLSQKYPGEWRPFLLADIAAHHLPDSGNGLRADIKGKWPLPNVWLGVSVEDQAAADERVPLLLQMPAAVRWISAEPLLETIDLRLMRSAPLWGGEGHGAQCLSSDRVGLNWVVCGGESGPKARPMHPDWARSLRDQCAAAGIPFHFKQWGEWGNDGRIPMLVSIHEKSHFLTRHGEQWTGASQSCPKGTAAMLRIGKKAAGRLLDGCTHDGYPDV